MAFCEYGERRRFCVDWNDAGENVEAGVPAVFALFLREERKSVAFCEYGERRRFCVDWNDERENVEAGVPAVSMARRRIERLRGVQFCRRTMEIRSEVSRPPDWFRPAWLEDWSVSSLLLSGFGRAGVTDECDCAFFHACSAPFRRNNPSARPPSTNEQSHGGLCPHPPRNLRFLGSSFRCRPFGRTNVPPRNAGASRDHRGAAPPPRTSPASETHPSGQAVTTTAQTAPPQRGSNWVQAQPARRKPRPPRRSAAAPNFALTRNAPQRSSADHRRADRAAQTRQQLGAGSACLSLLCGRGGRGGGSPDRSGG